MSKTGRTCSCATEITFLRERIEHLQRGIALESRDVEQHLGKALGYPWFKDDQQNFPGATEADGVCVFDHVPGTIAAEAAGRIMKLQSALEECYRVTLQVRDKSTTPARGLETIRRIAEAQGFKEKDDA